MDPFGNYVADIQEGLNDAFDGPSSPKSSGEYGAKEEDSEQARSARPSAASSTTELPAAAASATIGDSAAAAAPLENGAAAESDPPSAAEAEPSAVEEGAEHAAPAGMLPPPISTRAASDERGPQGAATPLHAAPDTAFKAAAMDAVLQKDAFLVFRALCKLSIRTADASSGTDLTAIRGKVRQQNVDNPKSFHCHGL